MNLLLYGNREIRNKTNFEKKVIAKNLDCAQKCMNIAACNAYIWCKNEDCWVSSTLIYPVTGLVKKQDCKFVEIVRTIHENAKKNIMQKLIKKREKQAEAEKLKLQQEADDAADAEESQCAEYYE